MTPDEELRLACLRLVTANGCVDLSLAQRIYALVSSSSAVPSSDNLAAKSRAAECDSATRATTDRPEPPAADDTSLAKIGDGSIRPPSDTWLLTLQGGEIVALRADTDTGLWIKLVRRTVRQPGSSRPTWLLSMQGGEIVALREDADTNLWIKLVRSNTPPGTP